MRALEHVFSKNPGEVMLVGGTALAGFYAGHRRSDDLDLFTRSEFDQRATLLAVRSLAEIGAELLDARQSAQYFHASARLDGHLFTIDVVLDPQLFEVGGFHVLEGGLHVASLDTLLCTKAATLVSRCSEKDLFDLLWIMAHVELTLPQLIERGRRVDSGLDEEALLISLNGARLSEDACGFGVAAEDTPRRVLQQVSELRGELLSSLSADLHKRPSPPLGKTVQKIRTWSKPTGRRKPEQG
ncbi:MAG: nucleotidyl transferase AbiEii/AbiGii toxin family protein [Pseudomonadota bacterium]